MHSVIIFDDEDDNLKDKIVLDLWDNIVPGNPKKNSVACNRVSGSQNASEVLRNDDNDEHLVNFDDGVTYLSPLF